MMSIYGLANSRLRVAALMLISSWTAAAFAGTSIPIKNASFETPLVDPNGFPAVPFVDGWIEIDVDTETSSNTGVFANPAEGSPDRLINADGYQLAFLGSQTGNALEQDLIDTYRAGCDYTLTVAVGVSAMFGPSTTEPTDELELVLYYRDDAGVVDIAWQSIDAAGLSSTELKDFSLYLPPVQSGDAWAGRVIGVALRAAGMPGGFWDIDNVRLIESAPVSIPIVNSSFESPVVDPTGFSAVPIVDGWTEIDLDTETSANTGVFANPAEGSPGRLVNADGNQLAFLGTQTGNALEQDLLDAYRTGCDYRLTAAVGVSGMFPPSTAEPADTLELVLYYRDGDQIVDAATQTAAAAGLSSTELKDFSLRLPTVQSQDAYAGKTIGVALRASGMAGGFWDIDNVRLTESSPASVQIENPSFETPIVDPNGFLAVPFVDAWTELDLDTELSTNTGVFLNPAEGNLGRLINAEGSQLAFLGSGTGNALEQDLTDVYKPGRAYRLTVAVGVSGLFPPSMVEPVDMLELVLYYRNGQDAVDIAREFVEATGLSSVELQDFSVYLPPVESGDAYAGMAIGVALRSAGLPGGFWDIDNVHLVESLPKSVPIANASFEAPVIDPNGFPAAPVIDQWIEIDVDTLASANTGVFGNTAEGSWDHKTNAHGQQLAFLGSEQGNALEQDLPATYKIGCDYRLIVAVGVSSRFAPSTASPVDLLELALLYRDGDEFVDIVSRTIDATGLSDKYSTDISLHLPSVRPEDAWAEMPITVAFRAVGMPGGFWVLDDVRLAESPFDQISAISVAK